MWTTNKSTISMSFAYFKIAIINTSFPHKNTFTTTKCPSNLSQIINICSINLNHSLFLIMFQLGEVLNCEIRNVCSWNIHENCCSPRQHEINKMENSKQVQQLQIC